MEGAGAPKIPPVAGAGFPNELVDAPFVRMACQVVSKEEGEEGGGDLRNDIQHNTTTITYNYHRTNTQLSSYEHLPKPPVVPKPPVAGGGAPNSPVEGAGAVWPNVDPPPK